MSDLKKLTIDWNRSIHINSPIDDNLVQQLTPKILALRQASNEPITIGIDSPGGSLASLDVIIGLLKSEDQDGNSPQIITVATHKAYSAAANFLAFGDYAVAQSQSQILYHDVRYGGMEDVTPEKARDAAKSLQDANDAFALRLAHRIIKRLIWIYIDLRSKFAENEERYQATHKRYSGIISAYAPKSDDLEGIDLASFATTLWAKLSRNNDSLVTNVMERLAKWIHLTKIAKSAPTYKPKGSRVAGMLDGPRHLHKLFKGPPENFEDSEESLKLLLSLIVADLATKKPGRKGFNSVLERASREFLVLESMNESRHITYASNILMQHAHLFLDGLTYEELSEMSPEERERKVEKATPHARLLWHFCVLLCRELFEGEHILTPEDAQLLGLVDEVPGGGPVMSKREFRKKQAANNKKETPINMEPT